MHLGCIMRRLKSSEVVPLIGIAHSDLLQTLKGEIHYGFKSYLYGMFSVYLITEHFENKDAGVTACFQFLPRLGWHHVKYP